MGFITYLRHRSAAPGPGVGELPEGVDVRAQSWDGGPDGVLVLHGFTGSPHSMRPWAREWARRGYAVELPLLPGHATRWQDLAGTTWQDWYGDKAGLTTTTVVALDETRRREEIARMLSGAEITDEARAAAARLIG